MKNLSLKFAEEFSKEIFGKMNEEERDFRLVHVKAMIDSVKILSQNENLDLKSLKIACWLHDIGYSISEENHALHSLEILRKNNIKINSVIEDCILNHGSKTIPKTKEGKIMQIADKISLLNPRILELLKNYSLKKNLEERKKDFEFIKKMVDVGLNFFSEEK